MCAIGSQVSSVGPNPYQRIRNNVSPTSAYLCFFERFFRWSMILSITNSSVSGLASSCASVSAFASVSVFSVGVPLFEESCPSLSVASFCACSSFGSEFSEPSSSGFSWSSSVSSLPAPMWRRLSFLWHREVNDDFVDSHRTCVF